MCSLSVGNTVTDCTEINKLSDASASGIPVLELQWYTTIPGYLHRFWGRNSSPHVCMVGALLTKPSPSPPAGFPYRYCLLSSPEPPSSSTADSPSKPFLSRRLSFSHSFAQVKFIVKSFSFYQKESSPQEASHSVSLRRILRKQLLAPLEDESQQVYIRT